MQTISEPESENTAVFRDVKKTASLTRCNVPEQGRTRDISLGWQDPDPEAIYRVFQEECTKLRECVPYVELYRYNPKHLYPKLNGYGDNGQRSLKL